jgi:glycosyltransferase involved in cell wall biosynthesis
MSPLVSICIPTFNAEKYLKECLESVISQTLTDFEILIVDNQSTDQTLEIVKSYAEHDSRFRIIVNEHNIGAINNFNRCAELANGEWIKYVHADDLIAPDCLEKLLSAKQPNSDLICCRRNFLFESGVSEKTKKYYLSILSDRSIDSLFPNSTDISAQDFCKATLENIGFNIVGEPVAVLVNRNMFYRYGTFNRHIINKCDVELWTRIAIHTGVTYVPQALATHRVHSDSMTIGNTTDRHYRKSQIDQLILLHEFVLNPIYIPLRSANHKPALKLLDMLALKAYEARRIAEKSVSNSSSSSTNPNIMHEWEEIQAYYPALSSISKLNFTQRLSHYSRRLSRIFKD